MHIINILRIFIFAAITGFFVVGCNEKPEKAISGTVTANSEGEILFQYSRTKNSLPESCTFTTDLPEPDNEFILTIVSDNTAKKEIDGLTAGQEVSWTAKVDGKPLNHGSDHFVHIVND